MRYFCSSIARKGVNEDMYNRPTFRHVNNVAQ